MKAIYRIIYNTRINDEYSKYSIRHNSDAKAILHDALFP